MKAKSTRVSKIVRIVAVVSFLSFAGSYTTVANAAQGCGFGYHLTVGGKCILNHPGPGSTWAPFHPGCWRKANGELRCYR